MSALNMHNGQLVRVMKYQGYDVPIYAMRPVEQILQDMLTDDDSLVKFKQRIYGNSNNMRVRPSSTDSDADSVGSNADGSVSG